MFGDLRYGARQIANAPVLAGAIVVVLALGVGAPHVATVLAAGARVTVTAVGLGRATVSAMVTDRGGLSAVQSFAVTVNSPAIRPPEPVGALPPLTLGVDDPAVAVAVGGAFRDPDGDRLTYRAASSAPAVAAAAVLGSTVTVTPTGEGTATVTVTSIDAGGSNGTATQTFTATVGPAGARRFTDDPIVPGVTPGRAVHFTELRSRIDALRVGTGLGGSVWTDPVLRAGVTPVRGVHLLELREALSAAYAAAGRAAPRWTDASPSAGSTPIRAAHVTELRAAVLALGIPDLADSTPFTIETVAGNGAPDVGDGRSATAAVLERPLGVLAAADGSFYVVDTYNNRVRRVTVDGIITTVAGTGSGETRDWGDGLPATQAQLRLPRSAKIAPDGTLWIVDTNNYRIRRVGTDGIMQTVAFDGGSNDNPRDDVPAIGAESSGPMDIAFDADGGYYIADSAANRIRRVGPDGIIRTAGHVSRPQSLASDGQGGLIIASGDGGALRRLDMTTGVLSSIEDASGRFVTADRAGNIYFVDGNQVYRLGASDAGVTLVAGRSGPGGFSGDNGPATEAVLSNPQRLSVDPAGVLYIADAGNDRVRRVDREGRITTVAGGGTSLNEGSPAELANVYDAQGIAVDARGSIFFTDFLHAVIRKVDESRRVRTIAGGRGNASLQDNLHPLSASIGTPSKIEFDRFGNLLVLDENNSVGVVRLITPGADGVIDGSADELIRTIAGQYRPRAEADRGRADGGPARSAVFDAARAFALDAQGRLFIADVSDHRVRMVVPGSDGVFDGDADEIITTIAGTGTALSAGDGGLAKDASLFYPGGYGSLAVDAQDNVYVIENTTRIRRIDQRTGLIDTVWNSRGSVWSIEFDQAGWAYVPDSTRIRRFRPEDGSVVEVVAGIGESGFSGDDGPATEARLRGAQFLAIDLRGDVYFPDNGNFRIRVLLRAPDQPTEPGRTTPLTLDLTCHGYDEGATRAYNCIPVPSQQRHMQTFVPAVGSACDQGSIAEFPAGRIVFQIRCRDGSSGQSAAWWHSGQGPEFFVKPIGTPRVWVRTSFLGSSVHLSVWCRAPQENLVVNELLGTSWGNDGTNGIYGMAGCREVEVDTAGEDLQWWFAQELAAPALTPPRSWEQVTGAGSALGAEALQDLATAAELERRWRQPDRWGMNPGQGANTRGAVLTSDDDGGTRLDFRIASGPDDGPDALDGAPLRGATRTSPLTIDLTCHGYNEGAARGTRAYNCIPVPSQQRYMRTFVPAVGSACDRGSIAEFPAGRIVFQIRCRDGSAGQSGAWSYSGQGPAFFEKPLDTPRVGVRTSFSGSSVHLSVWCRAPQENLVVNELLGTSWGNDGTNGIYGMAGCREVEVDTGGGEDLQWWFTQDLAATALTPPRSWEQVSGAGRALPAEALQDLATATELERLWSRPGR